MKVRATAQGFYLGRHIDPGTVFDVAPEFFADAAIPFGWMEKYVDEKRSQTRDPGEADQHKAENSGLVARVK